MTEYNEFGQALTETQVASMKAAKATNANYGPLPVAKSLYDLPIYGWALADPATR